MSEPELRPLLATRSTNLSEDSAVTNIIENIIHNAASAAIEPTAESPKPVISMADPDSITEHPISQGLAHDVCCHSVGLGRTLGADRWKRCLPAWWDRLRSAPTPEEKLSCERMINSINEAAGLHQMRLAEMLHRRNKARRDQEDIAELAAEKAAEEAAAIERWR